MSPNLKPVLIEASPDLATLELLASWRREDFTTDPAQLAAAEKELADFKIAMNESQDFAIEH
jgi:hypothetical protein